MCSWLRSVGRVLDTGELQPLADLLVSSLLIYLMKGVCLCGASTRVRTLTLRALAVSPGDLALRLCPLAATRGVEELPVLPARPATVFLQGWFS